MTCSWRSIGLIAIALVGATATLAPGKPKAGEGGADLGVAILRGGGDTRFIMAPGLTMTLAIGVNNLRGTAAAGNTTLTVTLPERFAARKARPAPDRSEGRTVVWTLGTLGAGAFPRFVEVDIAASDALQTDTPYEVAASVTSSDAEAALDNNRDVMPIRVVQAAANLAVSSNLDHVDLFVERPTVASAVVTNLGTVTAKSSLLTLRLPEAASLTSSDPAPSSSDAGIIAWRLGDLAPSAGATISLVLALDPILAAGVAPPLVFALDAESATAEAKPENNHIEIARAVAEPVSDLKVWLTLDASGRSGAANPGDVLTGRITYGNFGRAAAEAVSLSLGLDSGLVLLAADRDGATRGTDARFPGGVHSWRLGNLAAGEAGALAVQIRVDALAADGSLAMATVTASVPDADSADNTAFLALTEGRR